MLPSLSETDIAWIAGLLEGEGSFGLDRRSATRYKVSTAPPAPYVSISMTDEDVIARLSHLLHKSFFSPRRRTAKGKQVYTLFIGDRETLSWLLPRLFPYFGKRRQQSVQECLDALAAWERWYREGGRSKMASEGGRARQQKKLAPPTSPPHDMV